MEERKGNQSTDAAHTHKYARFASPIHAHTQQSFSINVAYFADHHFSPMKDVYGNVRVAVRASNHANGNSATNWHRALTSMAGDSKNFIGNTTFAQ